MKIHSSVLTVADINRAAYAMPGVSADVVTKGSRSRTRSFDVKLEGNSTRRSNGGTHGAGSGYAATWDEWGLFMEYLYKVDPDALIGQYGEHEAFRDQTYCRFDSLTHEESRALKCKGMHTWEWTGDYRTFQCKKCGAQVHYED